MKDIKKFAREHGFEDVEDCRFTWNGYKVYCMYVEDCSTGYPAFILKNDDEIRLVTEEEGVAIMDTMPDDEAP